MQILRVDPLCPQTEPLALAAQALRQGQLVAFPTETVYGLGAHALDAQAVRRIFEAKQRPATNPLIVHVHDLQAARRLVRCWPEAAQRLALAFWPGPLTLILPRALELPAQVTASLDQVAVRCPAHPVALRLLELAALPVAAPSANRYTQVSPTRAEHVARSLGDRVDGLLDGGPCGVGLESTVLSLVQPQAPQLLRPGMISREAIEACLGQPVEHQAGLVIQDQASPSPGLAKRHYAPRARAHLISAQDWDAVWRRGQGPLTPLGPRPDAALLALGQGAAQAESPWGWTLMLPDEPHGYARALYDALHRVDELGAATVWIQSPPQTSAWLAVWDRLRRAVS